MKYFILLVILVGLGTGLYYEVADYKNLRLITSLWEIPKEKITQGYSLVLVEGGSLKYYQFTTANGFIGIAKQLWLISALVIGVIAILFPLSIYVLKAFWSAELSESNESKKLAEKAIYKAQMDLIDAKNKYQNECDLKVKSAYDEQFKIVQHELSNKINALEKRENSITEREAIAERKISEANSALTQYRAEFQTLKSDFEEKEKLLIKSRNNAVAAMNRLKIKKEKITL